MQPPVIVPFRPQSTTKRRSKRRRGEFSAGPRTCIEIAGTSVQIAALSWQAQRHVSFTDDPGRAAALKIAAEGACVGCLDVNQVAAAETATAIADAAGTAVALAADVADEAQVERAVTKAEETFGGLDTVVANAGILLAGQDDRADRLDVGVWRRVLDVNLTGMFLTCKHGIRALLRRDSGAVVCTASPTGPGCGPATSCRSTAARWSTATTPMPP